VHGLARASSRQLRVQNRLSIAGTIKQAPVKSIHRHSVRELQRHVRNWLAAYNFAKQRQALRLSNTAWR
jgi:hypothetical protein